MQDVLTQPRSDGVSVKFAGESGISDYNRIKPLPILGVNIREGILREAESRVYAESIQQRGIPDRRYGINNMPSQQLRYYTGGQWDMTKHRLWPKEYVYYRTGIPYIPASKILDEHPERNLFDDNPANHTQVIIPDIFWQREDRLANPRTERPNAVQSTYDRQMGLLMMDQIVKRTDLWTKSMVLNYVRKHPQEFYTPRIHTNPNKPSVEEQLRHREHVNSRHILRRPNGKYVEKF